jgi:ABC-type branched-subunit amino acid transport system substrate-binding protein
MPRVALTPAEFGVLRGYLGIVGTAADREPGVGPAEIRIGAVLPLSGADAPAGWAVQAAIRSAFAEAGPIFGRSLALDVEDAGGDVTAATVRLTDGNRVLALVATLVPDSADASIPVAGRLDLPASHAAATGTAAADRLIEALKQVGARPTRVALSAALKASGDSD